MAATPASETFVCSATDEAISPTLEAARLASASRAPRDGELRFRDVTITYPARQGRSPLIAVDRIDLCVHPQEFVVLVGPSGCGKTSLLKVAAGLQHASSGAVLINGQAIERGRTRSVSVVFQSPRLLPWLSLEANVALPLEAQRIGRRPRKERAHREIRAVGLAGFERAFPNELSGGMQQRANLARALTNDAPVLLLDEPFAALDAQTRETMQAQLLDVWATESRTALFITHQVDEAVFLADRVVVLSSRPGRVREVVDIPFPRPRALEIKRTSAFHEIEDHIWSLLREHTTDSSPGPTA